MAASVILMALTAVAILAIERVRVRHGGQLLMLQPSIRSRSSTTALHRRRPRRPRHRRRRDRLRARPERERARARCCARSPGWSPTRRGPVAWDGADLAGVPAAPSRRSASCSRTTRCSRIATCSATSASGCGCSASHAPRSTPAPGAALALVGLDGLRAPPRPRAVGRRAATRRAGPGAGRRAAPAHARRAARRARPRRCASGWSPSSARSSCASGSPPCS